MSNTLPVPVLRLISRSGFVVQIFIGLAVGITLVQISPAVAFTATGDVDNS